MADSFPEDSDHPVTLDELVYVALGEASMCWIPNTGDAVFDGTRVSEIGQELLHSLRARGAK